MGRNREKRGKDVPPTVLRAAVAKRRPGTGVLVAAVGRTGPVGRHGEAWRATIPAVATIAAIAAAGAEAALATVGAVVSGRTARPIVS